MDKNVKQIKRLGNNSSDEGALWRGNASIMPLSAPEVMMHNIGIVPQSVDDDSADR